MRLPEEEQGPGNAGAGISGGRYLCLECSGSVVVDNEDAWILYEEIKQFMMNELDLTMPERMPPLHVVTEESMRLSIGRDQKKYDSARVQRRRKRRRQSRRRRRF